MKSKYFSKAVYKQTYIYIYTTLEFSQGPNNFVKGLDELGFCNLLNICK